MKKLLWVVFPICFISLACEKNSLDKASFREPADISNHLPGGWSKLADIPIDNTGEDFVLFKNGFAVNLGNNVYFESAGVIGNDFFAYNPSSNKWTRKSSISHGALISTRVGFTIGNLIYAGTGIEEHADEPYGVNDFHVYDPETNIWSVKSSLPVPISRSVAFSINNKGYIGTGSTGSSKEDDQGNFTFQFVKTNLFYEYDPKSDCWTRKADFPGDLRENAVGFTIGQKGYIGTGLGDGKALKDLWEYDPITDKWERKADFPGQSRYNAASFSVRDKGYIGTGQAFQTSGPSIFFDDFWEFDPASNLWREVESFPGGKKTSAVGIGTNSKGYLSGGLPSDPNIDPYRNNTWEFDPTAQ